MGCISFSITDELARYVLTKEEWIKKTFSFSRCADELFLQTIILNSKFKETVQGGETSVQRIKRYIDWERREHFGPHTFRLEDYDQIINSDAMFARKFDINVDREIIDKICEYLR